jgi:hypothetical protein
MKLSKKTPMKIIDAIEISRTRRDGAIEVLLTP